ncbi:hypothetical protein ACJ2A9_01960 [Anaerobacillus sp. MEB173]|uniref:hypothetical protein n=1 Tax=Anaerobacillus sp. MEB173 TaxID=3383345 RepID=UPI003F9227C1
MNKKVLRFPHSFFSESPFAKYIKEEQENDDFGLIFNEFAQEIGVRLGVDIIWDKANEEGTEWIIADDTNIKIILDENVDENEEFIFVPKTSKGQNLIEDITAQLKEEYGEYIEFDK